MAETAASAMLPDQVDVRGIAPFEDDDDDEGVLAGGATTGGALS